MTSFQGPNHFCASQKILLNALPNFFRKKKNRSISYLRKHRLIFQASQPPVNIGLFPFYSNCIQIKWHIQNKIGLTHAACFGLLVQVENCVKQPAVWGLCTNGSRVAGGRSRCSCKHTSSPSLNCVFDSTSIPQHAVWSGTRKLCDIGRLVMEPRSLLHWQLQPVGTQTDDKYKQMNEWKRRLSPKEKMKP